MASVKEAFSAIEVEKIKIGNGKEFRARYVLMPEEFVPLSGIRRWDYMGRVEVIRRRDGIRRSSALEDNSEFIWGRKPIPSQRIDWKETTVKMVREWVKGK